MPFKTFVLLFALLVLRQGYAQIRDAASLSKFLMAIPEDQKISEDFSIEAKVSYTISHEPNNLFIILEDATGSTLINPLRSQLTRLPVPGDIVKASGEVSSLREIRATAPRAQLSILRHGPPPTPCEPTAEQLESGDYDWRFASICGFVHDVLPSETSDKWIILVLVSDGRHVYVSIPLDETDPAMAARLIGCDVRAEGFCNPLDGSVRHHQGRIFQCKGISALHQLANTKPDPFASPPIESIRHLSPEKISTLGYRRCAGNVLAVWGKGDVLIRTRGNDVVRLTGISESAPRRGEFIEAAGFPLSDLFHITLAHAVWRPTRPWKVRERKPVSLEEWALNDSTNQIRRLAELHGTAVNFTGSVRNLPDETLRPGILVMETTDSIVPIDVSAVPGSITNIKPGAKVSVTGICIVETENWRPSLIFPQIQGFRIIVNDAANIALIANPSWWTPQRLLVVIGALLSVLIGICIWNRALNRLADRRGRNLLREQLGHIKADLKTEERTRLAVELHDSLAQNLTGVSMEIETAQRCKATNPQEMDRHLDIADKALKSCRHELRNTLWDLRNSSLDEHDMGKAIQKTLLPHVSDVRLAVRFNVPRSRLSEKTAHDILRIIRELTLNGIRHGGATEIRIAGSVDDGTLLFSVTDNGRGFDAGNCPGVAEGHFGLEGIRERLQAHSGTISFASTSKTGTKAVVTIPLHS